MSARYALGIEYSGSNYCGWQHEKHCLSVQEHLQQAIAFVANHPVQLVCAGRTDAGVHAVEQVVHFESDSQRDSRAWILGSNTRMPRDIRIKWIKRVDQKFHARFSAVARSYRYIIQNSSVPSAIFHDKTTWEYRPLDHEKMQQCAQVLIGEHDFSSFRATGCQAKSANRNVHSIDIIRQGDFIYLDIKANAFLYHMVRNIAGSLMVVGSGDRSIEWFAEVFAARDRSQADVTAPAAGLFLLRAFYPEVYNLPHAKQKPVLF